MSSNANNGRPRPMGYDEYNKGMNKAYAAVDSLVGFIGISVIIAVLK